ncbi:unnamed protein product, partial [Prunus brigantina]
IVVRFLLLQILYEINFKFVEELKKRIGFYYNRLSWMSIIEEGAVKIYDSGLPIVVGVWSSDTSSLSQDFYELWPQKFQCKTNGVTQRRWIVVSNPSLCALISKWLGTEAWIRDVDLLTGLRAYAADPDLQQEWMMGDSRLNALDEEVRLLWAASRSSTTWIFNGCLSSSNGHALIWPISLQNNGFKFMEFLWSRVTRFGF